MNIRTAGKVCTFLTVLFLAVHAVFGAEDPLLHDTRARARSLFLRFENFKTLPQFRELGFAPAGPFHEWHEELARTVRAADALRNRLPDSDEAYRINIFVTDLQNYALAHLRGPTDPRNRDLINFLHEELVRNLPPAPPKPKKKYTLEKIDPGSITFDPAGKLSEAEIRAIWPIVEKDIRRRAKEREIMILKDPEDCLYGVDSVTCYAEVPLRYSTKNGKSRKTTLAYTITISDE